MAESCRKKINCFCYLCGKYVFKHYRHKISKPEEEIYEYYYGKQISKNVDWAPNIMCKPCTNAIHKWWNRDIESLPLGKPMEWNDPVLYQEENCFICANNDVFGSGFNSLKNKVKQYIGVESTVLPLPSSDEIPVPKHPKDFSPSVLPTVSQPTNLDLDPGFCSSLRCARANANFTRAFRSHGSEFGDCICRRILHKF